MSTITTESGLQYIDEVVGEGEVAKAGQNVTVHYTGWLRNDDGTKGAKFDSSKDRNDPFEFALGAGMVIRGWDDRADVIKIGAMGQMNMPRSPTSKISGAFGGIAPHAT